jgi:hypothetical protein
MGLPVFAKNDAETSQAWPLGPPTRGPAWGKLPVSLRFIRKYYSKDAARWQMQHIGL